MHQKRLKTLSQWAGSSLAIAANTTTHRCLDGAGQHRHTLNDPGLVAVINAWDRLPEAVRAGIVAIVKAAGP